MRPRHWAVSVLSALVGGCSGDPFFYAPDSSQNQGVGAVPVGMVGSGASNSQASAGSGQGAAEQPSVQPQPNTSPCGPLRGADPSLEDGEVCVEESFFVMGNDEELPIGEIAHWPVRELIVSAFVLGEHEVSVVRYRQCVDAGACQSPREGTVQGCTYTPVAGPRELYPVNCVTHGQAAEFCAWDVAGGRLPTEAQWERAARGVGSRLYPWGDELDCGQAVVGNAVQCPANEGTLPRPVGSAPTGVSAEGAYDLIGNVSEWVADWAGLYLRDQTTDPTGPETGAYRVYRGGGSGTPLESTAAYLRWTAGAESTSQLGFRCVRPADP